jgi:hypothetical protein
MAAVAAVSESEMPAAAVTVASSDAVASQCKMLKISCLNLLLLLSCAVCSLVLETMEMNKLSSNSVLTERAVTSAKKCLFPGHLQTKKLQYFCTMLFNMYNY